MGLINLDWKDLDSLSDSDITYFLSLEGKTIEAICRIRRIEREEVQRQLIEGKIKYRFLNKSNSEEDLFQTLCSAVKQDKLSVLANLNNETREKLIRFIREEYGNMPSKNKETAIWIIGELKVKICIDILVKSVVHKHVNIRRMAVSALGKLEDKASEMPLIRALEDENSQVVLYAIKSLVKIKSEKAVNKIKQIYVTTEKDYLKRAAEEFLGSFSN
jgi:HEAT repeat protein